MIPRIAATLYANSHDAAKSLVTATTRSGPGMRRSRPSHGVRHPTRWCRAPECPGRGSARTVEPEDGPRLRLAIDRPVHAGEHLSLHWEGASDDIDELEILLSVDGGRTYTECISPSLDPRTGKYEWTVPRLGGAVAFLRVRFYRDGHEFEGVSPSDYRHRFRPRAGAVRGERPAAAHASEQS